MEKNNAVETAVMELNRFIRKHGMRYTQERETILRTIYSMQGNISIGNILKQHKRMYPRIHVCRSTVYNCIRLLLEINIINEMKDKNNTVYHRVFGNMDQVELICKRCHSCKQVSVENISSVVSKAGSADFHVHGYRLTLYGICATCKMKERETVEL